MLFTISPSTQGRRGVVLQVALLALAACGACNLSDTKADATANDGGGTHKLDAGSTDAGSADAGSADAGGTDAGGTDAGSTDAGSADAGSADAGGTDAGGTDAGGTDAGGTDASTAPSVQENLSAFADWRYGMFIHFNMGTFSDEEWASPNQDPLTFAPSNVDTDQWADVAAAAKMKFGILTTKHHDGFCLWPTAYTNYNAMSSGYKHDIVKMYTDSFRAKGLKVGLYFSVWDKTHDVQAYNNGRHGVAGSEFIEQSDVDSTLGEIEELMTNYGKIDLFITDGYSWQAGQQSVPYQKIRELVKSLQPNCILLDIGGLSVPYLGDAIFFEEPLGVHSPTGNTNASCQGQTISAGWFWHPSTPTSDPMSSSSIVSHLTDLESKYTNFILNCPPNRNGRLDSRIVERLNEVAASWSPNTLRAPLPPQPLRVEYPITPRSAYAATAHAGEEASNAIDGRSDVNYETCWSTWGAAALPQSITIDLGGVFRGVSTLEYLPKQWGRNDTTDADITSYVVSTSTDGVDFTQRASGNWVANRELKFVEWASCDAAYVRIQVNAASGDYANLCEVRIGGRTAMPALVSATAMFNASDYFKFINYANRMALDSGGNVAAGSSAKQWGWEQSPNLQWQIVDAGDGYYRIVNKTNGMVLDSGGDVAGDSDVKQRDWITSPNLQWTLQRLGEGFYRVINRTNGMVLDSGGKVPEGSAAKQSNWNGSTGQMWLIEKVPQ